MHDADDADDDRASVLGVFRLRFGTDISGANQHPLLSALKMVTSKVQTVSNAGHYLKLTAFGDAPTTKRTTPTTPIMLMVIGHPFWECFGSALGLLFFNGANQHHLFRHSKGQAYQKINMKEFVKIDATTFLMLKSPPPRPARPKAPHGMSFMQIPCHVIHGHDATVMARHPVFRHDMSYMDMPWSWHVMPCSHLM